ncbi:MAG: helix-turn-helix transcriptional regulator [Acidobacteria bacterium]|nr:helix-turn-helix transcriptional regulator [Acidobacteriota bacterium]
MPSTNVSTIFAALADPTRRAILARLSKGEAPVKDLAEPFSLSGPAITKHLKVLERAGLISRSRDGQQRPCRLEPRALAPAADWIEQYRAMWEERLDRLDAYLKSSASAPTRQVARTKGHKAPDRKPTRNTRGTRHGQQK